MELQRAKQIARGLIKVISQNITLHNELVHKDLQDIRTVFLKSNTILDSIIKSLPAYEKISMNRAIDTYLETTYVQYKNAKNRYRRSPSFTTLVNSIVELGRQNLSEQEIRIKILTKYASK